MDFVIKVSMVHRVHIMSVSFCLPITVLSIREVTVYHGPSHSSAIGRIGEVRCFYHRSSWQQLRAKAAADRMPSTLGAASG